MIKEEKAKAYRKEKQKEKKRKAEEELGFEDDDEMAAVMGFSGFGCSKKGHWSFFFCICLKAFVNSTSLTLSESTFIILLPDHTVSDSARGKASG